MQVTEIKKGQENASDDLILLNFKDGLWLGEKVSALHFKKSEVETETSNCLDGNGKRVIKEATGNDVVLEGYIEKQAS